MQRCHRLDNGNELRITAPGNTGVDTSYVHRVRWNGVELKAFGIAWEELRQGGTLAFDTAAAPCEGGSWPC